MTGLELLKDPSATAGEIADIVSKTCPPVVPTKCEGIGCRMCWFAWLTTGQPPQDGPEGMAPTRGYDLTRFRQLLREVDAYFTAQDKKEGPSDKQTAPDLEKERARLTQLLQEMDDYVNGHSRGHTSQ